MQFQRRLRWLKGFLLFTGIAFSVGVPLLTTIWPDAWMWEPRQSEYEQMLVGLYVTLGIFVLYAARDPMNNLSLIWFTACSSVVHGAIMAMQAVVDPAESGNLIGDIPALLLIGIILMWLTPGNRTAVHP